MAEYETKSYFGGDSGERFATGSPFLVSSSPWLNDPRARDYMAKHALRRNHREVPPTADIPDVMPIIHDACARRHDQIEELFVKERKANKALDAWFEERFVSSLTAETLQEYPRDSVGNLFYRFATANNFVTEFKTRFEADTHLAYFQMRLSQQHDLEHILSGFGFEYIGEQAVTWMRHGAYFRYLSPELAGILNETYAFLMVPQMMRTMLHYPQTMETVWDEINRGVLIGRTSEPVFLMKYEPVLHLPVAEARKVLGYRNVQDRDVREMANIWAEGIAVPLDPRFGEELSIAAE